MCGTGFKVSLLAASEALVGRIVQVGSFRGGCVLHTLVIVVVETVLENCLAVRVRVDVEVQ